MNHIYLENIVLSYQDVIYLLYEICNNKKYNNRLKKEKVTHFTTFGYPINSYFLGHGKKHVILLAATHGCEIITNLFVLEFILTLVLDDKLYKEVCNEFTFHFIPILNIEGYIISSSQIVNNLKKLNYYEIECVSRKYLNAYNLDDMLASENKIYEKTYKNILKTSCSYIPNKNLIKSVNCILKNCNLDSRVLPVWSANGIGVDPNSNSINKFKEMVALRKSWKYAKLRYNDIPVTKPSPMSYPGLKPLYIDCPENVFLYQYITDLYTTLPKSNEKLISIFSYHSTGGMIFGYPDKCITSNKNILLHNKAVDIYSSFTHYTKIYQYLKFGVMDFYRAYLENVVSLTIELSKLNANPIGPFANINELFKEFNDNKRAILTVIQNI